MGQAKRRGTFEERKAQSIVLNKEIRKAAAVQEEVRLQELHDRREIAKEAARQTSPTKRNMRSRRNSFGIIGASSLSFDALASIAADKEVIVLKAGDDDDDQ